MYRVGAKAWYLNVFNAIANGLGLVPSARARTHTPGNSHLLVAPVAGNLMPSSLTDTCSHMVHINSCSHIYMHSEKTKGKSIQILSF